MNKSESIKNIAAALALFQVKAEKIIKTAENPFFKSKYADLPSILDSIALPLQEAGLVISQFPDDDGLTTILMHPASGEFLSAKGIMHPVKSDPQSIGSAITYQRRYSLCAVLGLNVDGDDDGNAASRVNPPNPPKAEKAWLNKGTEEFTKAKNFMSKSVDKQAALKSLMGTYAISKPNQTELLNG